MKYFRAAAIGTVLAMSLSGCVVSGRGSGSLTKEEREEIKDALDEAQDDMEDALDEAQDEIDDAYDDIEDIGGLFGEIRDKVYSEVQSSLEETNWAEELFEDYDPQNSGKPLHVKAGTLDSLKYIEDTKTFFDGLNTKDWTLADELPENAEPEYLFVFSQHETETVFGDNNGYIEIARLEIYKDTNYVKLSMFDEFSQTKFGKALSAESLSSIYELSDKDAEFLRSEVTAK